MGSIVSGLFGGGDDAADAARAGSETAAQSQREALDYLKETERVPQALREQALMQLGALYGLPGVGGAASPQYTQTPQVPVPVAPTQFVSGARPEDNIEGGVGSIPSPFDFSQTATQLTPVQPQGSTIDMAPVEGGYAPQGKSAFIMSLMQDPFYQQLISEGEGAVLRGAGATGGLRSGAANLALARNSQDVLRGLYGEQVQGLSGLAGLGSQAPEISRQMAGVGQTLSQGQIAAAQAQQASQQQGFGNLMGLGSLAAKIWL